MKNEVLGPIACQQYLDYSGNIYSSGQHLLDLINDILDLSKVESGAEELRDEHIDVPSTLRSIERLVKHRADKGGVRLELHFLSEMPPIDADERKLKQVFVNLLTNAIKFTEPGGKVVLRTWCREESGFVFQVVDTGIGMAPKDIPKALSTFGQVDSALNRKYEGTGLGLPLTKALIELHGGSLDLQSELGVGTTVTVRFAAARIVEMQEAALARDEDGLAPGTADRKAS